MNGLIKCCGEYCGEGNNGEVYCGDKLNNEEIGICDECWNKLLKEVEDE